MADDNMLSGSLQETIITALVYANDSNSRIISRLVDLSWFEDPYREIVDKVLQHWRTYGEPPTQSHIDDVLDFALDNPNHRRHTIYNRVLDRLTRLNENLNTKYVYSRLFEFARRQNLKRAIFEAGTILSQSNTLEDYEKVEAIMAEASHYDANPYDLGFALSDSRALKFLDRNDEDRVPIAISELEKEGISPGRGEMFLIMAPRGRGKSMFLHHIGRHAIGPVGRGKWNVLHITLENSEDATAERYMHNRFNITSKEDARITDLETDKTNGKVIGFTRRKSDSKYFSNPELQREFLAGSINGELDSLRIKEFPTGDLTYDGLEAYLDHLEGIAGFVPNMILLDYPDLMSYDRRHDPRLGLGRLYQQLRGLAVKRNLAMVVVTQSNREGEKTKTVESHHAAEDISKIATADIVISYNQTRQEYELGLARLYVVKARNQRQWFSVLITQNYAASQFCLECAPMNTINNYADLLENPTVEQDEEENIYARATR
jgi:hypothetical protein